MVVAKDNLKTHRNTKLFFTEQKEQNDEYNGRAGVNHAARTQCFEFSPNRRMKKMK